MSLLQLLLKPANRNLLDVVTHLPKLGVGSRVARKAWEPYGDSYWEVTAVKPKSDDGSVGKVWGVLTWRGVKEERPRKINGRAKKVWRWIPTEQELAMYQPLVKELQRQQHLQRNLAKRAAEAAGAGSSTASTS
eukprot:GHRR01004290.1.p1 GENE.GHRR01004290.1~~GHRR01004290.1.p1  ORF type:complete len:134 (+),score=52.06 GHRR01004290.1:211-612(+)